MARVLIIDDALFMRKMLSDILIKDGHKIVGNGENGKEAVESYKRLKPDIVTLDIVMPVVDGMDALNALKTILREDPSARVIIVSAMGQQEMVVEYIQAGAKDFIVKPFQPSNISETVKRLAG